MASSEPGTPQTEATTEMVAWLDGIAAMPYSGISFPDADDRILASLSGARRL